MRNPQVAEPIRSIINQVSEQAAMSTEELICNAIRQVAELPDRTSPEDQPEMMLVTADELRGILSDFAAALTTR